MDDKTKQIVELFDNAATLYQEKYMDVSPYSETLLTFCNEITGVLPKILDVGSGPGNVAKFIFNQIPSSKITCIDLSSEMLALAEKNIPNVHVEVLDARKIKEVGVGYNAVVASFIFPYLSQGEVADFIQDVKSILRQDGVLYISTMVGKYENSGYIVKNNKPQMYTYWHEEDHITKLVLDAGFDICYSKVQSYDYGEENKGHDLLIIAKLK